MDISKEKKEMKLRIKKMKYVKKIAKKFEDKLLPLWEINYVPAWDGMLISYHLQKSSSPMADFSYTCDLIDESLGIKLKRIPWFEGENIFCIHGTGTVEYKKIVIKIEVRQFQAENCLIEYEEKLVKVGKISQDCLDKL